MSIIDQSTVEVNTYAAFGYAKDGTRIVPPSFTALTAPDANMAIEGVSSSSASGLSVGIGNSSRAVADGTGNQTVTHGLGVVPKLVQIFATQTKTGGTETRGFSIGFGVSPVLNKKKLDWRKVGTDYESDSTNGSVIINIADTAGTGTATADMTALDANTFTLNWSAISAATCEFTWSVFA